MTQTPERTAAIEAMATEIRDCDRLSISSLQTAEAALDALLAALPGMGWQLVPVVAKDALKP